MAKVHWFDDVPGWPPVWRVVVEVAVGLSLVALMNRVLSVLEPQFGTVWACAFLGALFLVVAFAGRAVRKAWRARNT